MPDPTADRSTQSSLRRRVRARSVVVVVTFSLAPFLGFLADNVGEVADPLWVVRTGLLVAVVVLAFWLVIGSIRSSLDLDRSAVVVAAIVLCFFNYYRLFDTSPPVSRPVLQVFVWAVLTALVAAVVWRLSRSANVRLFVLLLGILLCVVPVTTYLLTPGNRGIEGTSEPTGTGPSSDVVADRPDIYLFLLDEYARDDQLERYTGLDNTEFLADLEDRGFVVGYQAFSSYPKTFLSVPSILDMRYVVDEESGLPDGILQFAPEMRGQNALAEQLGELGYTYVYAETGNFDFAACDPELAICLPPLSSGPNLSEAGLALVRLTPLGAVNLQTDRITDPVYVLDELETAGVYESDDPFFLFAHILSPHSPQRYDEECRLHDVLGPANADQSLDDAPGYAQDVVCTNELVLTAVDRIASADPDAIIVVLSDHGSYLQGGSRDAPLDEWPEERLQESFGALQAMRLPEGCATPDGSPESIVNTFRYVVACLEGEPPDLLENRAFVRSQNTVIEEIPDAEERFARRDR